MSEAQE